MQKVRSNNNTEINNKIDYSIDLTKEDIEALKESEKDIENGNVYELKEGMTLMELLKEWRENNKQ